jgi:hypothetical protein
MGIVSSILLLAGLSQAPAQESYYVLMFGAQQTPPDPAHAHSFATFVRVCHNGPTPGTPVIEAHTISWLPANLHIRVFALLPEPGHNFELHRTLQFVLGDCQRVSMWGPYKIDAELYCRALKQEQLLLSGQVRYKAVDTGYSSDRVSNCIHALSSIAEGNRVRVLSPGWGETASFAILQRYSPWIIDTGCTHDWVASALGLDKYPIVYRDYENPRSGTFRGLSSRLTGRDPLPTYGRPR